MNNKDKALLIQGLEERNNVLDRQKEENLRLIRELSGAQKTRSAKPRTEASKTAHPTLKVAVNNVRLPSGTTFQGKLVNWAYEWMKTQPDAVSVKEVAMYLASHHIKDKSKFELMTDVAKALYYHANSVKPIFERVNVGGKYCYSIKN